MILIGCFIKLSVQTFKPLIVIYRRGNLVYLHLGCISINRPLTYPFRSLFFYSFFQVCLNLVMLLYCISTLIKFLEWEGVILIFSGGLTYRPNPNQHKTCPYTIPSSLENDLSYLEDIQLLEKVKAGTIVKCVALPWQQGGDILLQIVIVPKVL